MKTLDLAHMPLPAGRALIEAGAGSGKTFTLAGLYVRLVAQEDIPASAIAVVTFTRAAAAELRGRLHQRLLLGLGSLPEVIPDDPAYEFLRNASEQDRELARLRLARARDRFDEADITTIDSLCQGVLQRYPFETRTAGPFLLQPDTSRLDQAILDSFWADVLQDESEIGLAALGGTRTWRKWGRLLIAAFHRHRALQPDGRSVVSVEEARTAFHRAWHSLRASFEEEGRALCAHLADGSYNRRKKIFQQDATTWHERITRALAVTRPEIFDELRSGRTVPGLLRYLARETLEAHRKKKASVIDFATFDHASQMIQALEDWRRALWRSFVAHLPGKHDRLAEQLGQRSFDALIRQVVASLEGPNGKRLVRRLQQRWQVALVDEFQDTDDHQRQVFERIFGDPGQRLYLIGDPKQAIYGFRGADLETYLEAAEVTPEQWSLDTNWRSQPHVIQAINAVFQATANPFDEPRITYRPQSVGNPHKEVLSPGLVFRLLDADTSEAITAIRPRILTVLAHDVAQFLRDARTSPETVAVLTRTRKEAFAVARELRSLRVPCLVRADLSIFATKEARQVHLLLEVLLALPRSARWRAALASPLFGWTAEDLLSRGETPEARLPFEEAVSRWHDVGIMPGLECLFEETGVETRLLQGPRGERGLTNLRHLITVLHEAESRYRFSPRRLLRWLSQAIAHPEGMTEDATIQIEHDGGAVTVLTAHKAKGLEFPFVFSMVGSLPTDQRRRGLVLQRSETGWCAPYPDDLDPHAILSTDDEPRQERRLLYVALTRAIQQIHVYLTPVENIETAAFPQLLGATNWNDLTDQVHQLAKDHAAAITVETVGFPLPDLVTQEERIDPATLSARPFTRQLPTPETVASFSSMTAHETEDRQARHDTAASSSLASPVFSDPLADFPPGPKLGTALHAILEHMTLDGDALTREWVEATLAEHGLDPTLANHNFLPWIESVVSTPFWPGAPPGGLRETPGVLREEAFTLRCETLRTESLLAWIATYAELSRSETIALRNGLLQIDLRGYLRGMIDVVLPSPEGVLLFDWKTNLLPDYRSRSLRAAMVENAYYVQAAMYMAVVRRAVGPDTPVRGVRYLFLRGWNTSEQNGIYRWDLPADALDALATIFQQPRG